MVLYLMIPMEMHSDRDVGTSHTEITLLLCTDNERAPMSKRKIKGAQYSTVYYRQF
jgi:hypothetical protein